MTAALDGDMNSSLAGEIDAALANLPKPPAMKPQPNTVPDPKREPLAFLLSLARGVRERIGQTDANEMLAAIVAIREREARHVAALEFYENAKNWKDDESGIGTFPGAAIDYGTKARAALSEPRE